MSSLASHFLPSFLPFYLTYVRITSDQHRRRTTMTVLIDSLDQQRRRRRRKERQTFKFLHYGVEFGFIVPYVA